MTERLRAPVLDAATTSDVGASLSPSRLPPPEIVLDVSRLLSRCLHPTPTGVDRVEMAYARGLPRMAGVELSFSATHPCGLNGALSSRAVTDFLDLTAERWESEGLNESRFRRWRRAAATCLALAPASARPTGGGRRAYLHLSARSLERTSMVRAILRRERARFIPFVHDLIPLERPEYTRPGSAELYGRKIATVTSLADGVLVNSEATGRALTPHFAAAQRRPPIQSAPLGADGGPHWTVEPLRDRRGGETYFVVLGTIEPRKNHLLLLHLWRRLIELSGAASTPRLILIGRRGWEVENVLDLLDRCPLLRGVVVERSRLTDVALRNVLRGARALLFPSFAEGFGLPVAEALQLGVPVVASDLPALREAGGDVPDFLDPLDGPAWLNAVVDHARPDSAMRARQMGRLSRWRAPTWETHLATALDFISEVCA